MGRPPRRVVDLRRTESPGPGELAAARSRGLRVCGISSFDASGRLIGKALFVLLRWEPGTRVRVGAGHRLVARAEAGGPVVINSRGMLTISARERAWCRFVVGERVLLVAVVPMSALVIVGLEALDGVIANPRAVVDGMRCLDAPEPGVGGRRAGTDSPGGAR